MPILPNSGIDADFVRIQALARIRRLREQGKTYREIGDYYNISDTTVMRAHKRETVLKMDTCQKILDKPYQWRLL